MKLTEVWPASRVTVAGTVSRVVSLEVNWTVMFCVGAALEVTVPMIVPSVSWALLGRLTLSVAVSLSCTVVVAAPAAYPVAEAVMLTASGPFSNASSMIVTGTGAETCPAGMTTVAGTESRLGSLEARLTVRSLVKAFGILIAPATTPIPSRASVGTVTVTGGKLETLKVLLSPTCPLPSLTSRYMLVAACDTVTLPVHTPLTKVAVVGATGTCVLSCAW